MPQRPKPKRKTQIESVAEAGLYSPHAYHFIHEGLDYTVNRIHGPETANLKANRHVSGQQLCEGLRELALSKWGRMARTVLLRWNITSTLDFGKIVFSLIESGQMQKLDDDTLHDFKNVYDFKTAFETAYLIPHHPETVSETP